MIQEVKSIPDQVGTKVKNGDRGLTYLSFGESGQVLLIVILVIVISLTIGLSLASRGITNLRTSTEEADSQKALAAAEAGIEKALQNTVDSSGVLDIATFNTDVVSQGGDTLLLNGGSLITQGEGADVWFANHNADGTISYANTPARNPPRLHLYWGAEGEEVCVSSNPSTWPAAIEVIVVSGTSATAITTIRHTFDLCDGSPGEPRNNNFASAQQIGGGGTDLGITDGPTFMIRTPGGGQDLVSVGNLIFMRVIPVYKSSVIGVRACNNVGGQCTTLPSQGFLITSTGTRGTANRRLKVYKGFQQPFLPYISYGLFVPTK